MGFKFTGLLALFVTSLLAFTGHAILAAFGGIVIGMHLGTWMMACYFLDLVRQGKIVVARPKEDK